MRSRLRRDVDTSFCGRKRYSSVGREAGKRAQRAQRRAGTPRRRADQSAIEASCAGCNSGSPPGRKRRTTARDAAPRRRRSARRGTGSPRRLDAQRCAAAPRARSPRCRSRPRGAGSARDRARRSDRPSPWSCPTGRGRRRCRARARRWRRAVMPPSALRSSASYQAPRLTRHHRSKLWSCDAGQVAVPHLVDVPAVEEPARRQRALEDLVLGPARQRPAQPGRQRHAEALLRAIEHLVGQHAAQRLLEHVLGRSLPLIFSALRQRQPVRHQRRGPGTARAPRSSAPSTACRRA